MVTLACPICGESNLETRAPPRRPVYCFCKNCGHHFIDPRDADIESSFLKAQTNYYGDESILLDDRLAIFEGEIMEERYRAFRQYLAGIFEVVEVGPGAGHVLKWLKDHGHRVTGVEHSKALADQLATRLDISVINAEFEEHTFRNSSFDSFCSFHVIEHVRNPLAHLEKAHAMVRPGGFAFIATPNGLSWEQRAAPPLGPNFDAAHLHIFSPQSLRLACEKTGWRLEQQTTPESAGGWARVFSGMLRLVRHEDATTTAGKYAHSSSGIVRMLARFFQFLTIPLRNLQRRLGAGNEIFMVLRKPD